MLLETPRLHDTVLHDVLQPHGIIDTALRRRPTPWHATPLPKPAWVTTQLHAQHRMGPSTSLPPTTTPA